MTITSAPKRLARSALGPSRIDESIIAYDALKGRPGVMLDVGAHYGSSLAPFARDGWIVHAFEPDPANRQHLEARFGAYPNVTIVGKAVSDKPGKLPLYTSDESTGISSLAPFSQTHAPTAMAEIVTLRDYIAESGIPEVDLMKIDVEGFERNVLCGYDWAIKPRAIVLEFEDTKTVPLGYRWTDLADELVGHGYEVLVSEWRPIERYGAVHSWRRFARYPTALADPAAWGNLIAATSLADVERVAKRAAARHRVRTRVDRARARVRRRR